VPVAPDASTPHVPVEQVLQPPVHGALQHTLPTQLALEHSLPAAHERPFGLVVRHWLPPLQKRPERHPVSFAGSQAPAQPAPMQAKPVPHGVVVAPGQLPMLHWAELVMVPLEHVCARHWMVGKVQAVREAEQLPTHMPVPAHAVRPLPVWGAPFTCEQVPSTVATLHASH
jgi:hypothetical protein